MPLEHAVSIFDRVTAWAVRRYAATSDPLYASTSLVAGEVRAALASLGRERPRLLVERVIDQALDLRHPNPGSQADAARWRSVPYPGAVWAPRDAVVWWNFVTTREGAARSPWTFALRLSINLIRISLIRRGWEKRVGAARPTAGRILTSSMDLPRASIQSVRTSEDAPSLASWPHDAVPSLHI